MTRIRADTPRTRPRGSPPPSCSRGGSRLAASGSLVFVAIGIAAAVGLSRVYLRVHWWSDVAGGWGLGAGIFCLLGSIALVVEYIRHNGYVRGAETSEAAAARGA